MKKLTIASRESKLAMWQAEFIKKKLLNFFPNLDIDILGLTTQGDKNLDISLNKIGGKGLFVKELETALLNGAADIAVHSLKDMPYILPQGLTIGAICEREFPWDAFISNHVSKFSDLPYGAKVGTSSLRRSCQLKVLRPDLNFVLLRGNINTRLKKLDEDHYDAIVLAQAGLTRLALENRIRHCFSLNELMPAVGQGALAIECRTNDKEILTLINSVNHRETELCVLAERAFNRSLEGGCQLPIAAYAYIFKTNLVLQGLIGDSAGLCLLKGTVTGPLAEAEILGETLAKNLLEKGALHFLGKLRYDNKSSDE